MGAQSKKFQRGRILSAKLETILVIFGQRMCLLSAVTLKNLSKVKLKSFGLMALPENISRQLRIEWIMWLLLIALMQVINERSKWSKEI